MKITKLTVNGHTIEIDKSGFCSHGFYRGSCTIDGERVQVSSSAVADADADWTENGMVYALSHPYIISILAK